MKPLDISTNNQAIGPEGGVPGISCGCGGKNKGACGSKKDAATDCAKDCGCGGNCRCRKKSCCCIFLVLLIVAIAAAFFYAGWSMDRAMQYYDRMPLVKAAGQAPAE